MIPDNPNIYSADEHEGLLTAPLLFPDNLSYSPLGDWEMGGVGLSDTSQGLEYQTWRGYWDGEAGTAFLAPSLTGGTLPIFELPDTEVREFCFTFDTNMRWAAAVRLTDQTVQFRWYDSLAADYVTTTYAGITSVRLALDDKRTLQAQQGASDMVLTYMRGNRVHWRIQRDRFEIEYTYPQVFPSGTIITNFGMNERRRLQWDLL